MAAAVAASRGAVLAGGPSLAISRRAESNAGCRSGFSTGFSAGFSSFAGLPVLPARGSWIPRCKRAASELCVRSQEQRASESVVGTETKPERITIQAKKEEASSNSSAWPAGLTLASALCFLEFFATGAAEAAHAPQVNAGEFFTNATLYELLVWGAAVVGFIGFYFILAPPVLLTYFVRRWKKKQLAETFFMFAMTFVFFPALMVWAPFINTRPFPRSTGRYTAETDKAAFRGDSWRQ